MALTPLAQRRLAALGLPTYRSLAEFYASSEAREKSGEVDFGYHWCIDASRVPRWRVSYVQDTREVYALLLNTGDTTVVLLARGRTETPSSSRCPGGRTGSRQGCNGRPTSLPSGGRTVRHSRSRCSRTARRH